MRDDIYLLFSGLLKVLNIHGDTTVLLAELTTGADPAVLVATTETHTLLPTGTFTVYVLLVAPTIFADCPKSPVLALH